MARKKETVLRYIAEGLCVDCGKLNDSEKGRYCTACKEKRKEARLKRMEFRKANGICVRCGRPNDRTGFSSCSKCSEKESKKRMKRTMNGCCSWCGKPNDRANIGMSVCSVCSERARLKTAERKQKNLCVGCGTYVEDGKVRCPTCRKKNNLANKKQYYAYKNIGLCVECKTYLAVPGKTRCEVCLLKQSEEMNARRESTDFDKEEKKRRDKEYRDRKTKEARENGMCIKCWKRKAAVNRAKCVVCLERERYVQRERNRQLGRISHTDALEQGLCTLCHREKATHGKVCENCYQTHVKPMAESRDMSNHFWVQDNRAVFFAK